MIAACVMTLEVNISTGLFLSTPFSPISQDSCSRSSHFYASINFLSIDENHDFLLFKMIKFTVKETIIIIFILMIIFFTFKTLTSIKLFITCKARDNAAKIVPAAAHIESPR